MLRRIQCDARELCYFVIFCPATGNGEFWYGPRKWCPRACPRAYTNPRHNLVNRKLAGRCLVRRLGKSDKLHTIAPGHVEPHKIITHSRPIGMNHLTPCTIRNTEDEATPMTPVRLTLTLPICGGGQASGHHGLLSACLPTDGCNRFLEHTVTRGCTLSL